MLFLIVLLAILKVSDNASQSVLRGAFIENYLKTNKDAINSVKEDKVLSEAVARTLNTIAANQVFSDDSTSNLVLMDVSSTPCDAGWNKSTVNGMCYKAGAASSLSWYASEDWCYAQRYGSHLTSVHSQAEAQWIHTTYVSKGWLPWMDNWVGLRRSCDNTTYIWTDGTPVDFLWWQPGYPGSGVAEKSCVTIWRTSLLFLKPGYVPGQFDDIWDCGTNLATPTCRYDPDSTAPHIKYDTTYTCAETTTVSTTTVTTTPSTTPTTTSTTTITTTPSTTTTEATTTTIPATMPTTTLTTSTAPTTTVTTPSTTLTTVTTVKTTTQTFSPGSCASPCDTLWTPYNGGCYGIVKGTSDYETAELGCGAFGGVMAVITDADMNEAIRKAFSSNNDSSIMNQAWISASSYANWAPGKPNQAQGTGFQYCNVMALSVVNSGVDLGGFSRGVWMDYPCNKTQEYVICKQT